LPYVDGQARAELDADWREGRLAQTPGELNYVLTKLVIQYAQTKGLSYSTCNDIVGALEGAKAEFQRRVVAPYEDMKIKLNGDVYPRTWETK
jgi:hypothetical protein